MAEWWVPLVGLFGVLVGVGITEFRLWAERKDRYRIMTFEKRLQVHQEAYRLCMEQAMLMNDLHKKEPEVVKKFNKSHDEAKDWLNHNCLYLDTRSWRGIMNAFFAASIYGRDLAEQRQTVDKAYEYAHSEFTKCLSSIAKGIGAKYLPETDKKD